MSDYDWMEDDSLSPDEVRAHIADLEPADVVTDPMLATPVISAAIGSPARSRSSSATKGKSSKPVTTVSGAKMPHNTSDFTLAIA